LIVLGFLARMAPHPPNVTPVAALALFGGSMLPAGWAVSLPLAVLVLSDLAIGLHEVVAFTWLSFAATGLLGRWVGRSPKANRILAASLTASVGFFVVTNFGVWWLGDGGLMYPRTLEGLWQCYAAAVPFFRNSVIGDLAYTAGFFGVYRMARRASRLAPVNSPTQSV
jgi:hypothetical protein